MKALYTISISLISKGLLSFPFGRLLNRDELLNEQLPKNSPLLPEQFPCGNMNFATNRFACISVTASNGYYDLARLQREQPTVHVTREIGAEPS